MNKGKTFTKLALVTAFAAALAGCGPAPGAGPNVNTSTWDSVTVNTSMKVVTDRDNDIARFADFTTNQLCVSKIGSYATLVCRDFGSLSPEASDYVGQLRVLLQNPGAVHTSTSDHITINTTSRVFNEYGGYFERHIDFKTGNLCTSRIYLSSSLSCTDFADLSKAQKDYVDYARGQMDKVLHPAPRS